MGVILSPTHINSNMQLQILGNSETITKQDNTLVIKTAEATACVTLYSPTIIRVNISRNEAGNDSSFAVIQSPLSSVDYTDTADHLEVNTTALKLVINKFPLRFNFYTADGEELSQDDERFGVNWQGDRVINYRKLYADERFIGLGEKTGDLDRRGSSYVNWNSDVPNHGLTSDPLYETFPFFIGIHSGLTYGLFFDNTHKSYF